MKNFIKDIFGGLGIITLVVGGIIGAAFLSFWLYSVFAPKYEAVRRETFEQSRAFNEGMVRDLQNLRLQYLQATPEGKAALRATIIHRFSVYDKEALPLELRSFYTQIEKAQ
jgi:hypothetical protein